MKKLLALSLLGSSLLIGSNPALADWDVWGLKQSESDSTLYDVYTLDSDTQEATKGFYLKIIFFILCLSFLVRFMALKISIIVPLSIIWL